METRNAKETENARHHPRAAGAAATAPRRFYSHSRRTIWILVACLAGAIVAGLLFWVETRRQSREAPAVTEGSLERQELAGANLAKIGVDVYFRQVAVRSLSAFPREIFAAQSPEVRARQLMQVLIEGPDAEEADKVVAVLPRETKLRQVYLLEDGTAVVDLSEDVANLLPGGIDSEATAMESIRRTLLENVTEIKRVRFLINGKDTETFAGHIAL